MSSQGFGLIPGSNTSGTQISVPYSPQQGGQASLGGTMNPFLPVTTGTSTSIPMMPQGAVSNSATSGMPTSVVSGTSPSTPFPLLPYQSAGAPSGTGSPVPVGGPAPGAGAPTQGPTSAGATTPTSAGAALGVPTTTGGENKLLQTLNKAYGAGLGTTLYNFLASGAGYNQTAINNLIAALQPGYEMDQQNLLASFSAGGNRFSSGAQLGLSNLEGQEQLNIGQLETQMYEQSVSDYINVMMGAASGSNARKLQAGAATSSLIGNIINNLMQGASGSEEASIMAGCWVAAELYGGWYSPRTVAIRLWLSRTWWMKPFVRFYLKYGERWAAWIRKSDIARRVTKRLFDLFLSKAEA